MRLRNHNQGHGSSGTCVWGMSCLKHSTVTPVKKIKSLNSCLPFPHSISTVRSLPALWLVWKKVKSLHPVLVLLKHRQQIVTPKKWNTNDSVGWAQGVWYMHRVQSPGDGYCMICLHKQAWHQSFCNCSMSLWVEQNNYCPQPADWVGQRVSQWEREKAFWVQLFGALVGFVIKCPAKAGTLLGLILHIGCTRDLIRHCQFCLTNSLQLRGQFIKVVFPYLSPTSHNALKCPKEGKNYKWRTFVVYWDPGRVEAVPCRRKLLHVMIGWWNF